MNRCCSCCLALLLVVAPIISVFVSLQAPGFGAPIQPEQESFVSASPNQTAEAIWWRNSTFVVSVSGRIWQLSNAVACDASGSIYVVGTSREGVTSEFTSPYLWKYDGNGRLLWIQCLGTYRSWDYGWDVSVDEQGFVYVCTSTVYSGSPEAAVVVKMSPDGIPIWRGVASGNEVDAECGLAVTDSGLYVYARYSGPVVTKLDLNGSALWSVTAASDRIPEGIATDLNGSAYLVGYSPSGSWLVKHDPNGTVLWDKLWSDSVDCHYRVAVGSDDSAYVVGSTSYPPSPSEPSSVSLAKFAPNSTLAWNRSYGDFGPGYGSAYGQGITVGSDGTVYVTGMVVSNVSNCWNAFLMKVDPNGSVVQRLIFTPDNTGDGEGRDVTFEDGYVYVSGGIVTADLAQRYLLVKYDNNPPDLAVTLSLPPGNRLYICPNTTLNATIENVGLRPAIVPRLVCEFTINGTLVGAATFMNVSLDCGSTLTASVSWDGTNMPGTYSIYVLITTDVEIEALDAGYSNNLVQSDLVVYIGSDDSDLDGLPDDWEYWNGLNLWDPGDALSDNDLDGLSNLQEYSNQTSPNDPDSDDDLMIDGWEVASGSSPTEDDAGTDDDNDNLTCLREFQIGSNPEDDDTDEDGIPDGWEVDHCLDPLNATDAALDIEVPFSDGLDNLAEYLNGTNPLDADTDHDILGDGFEVVFTKTDPTLADTDCDGVLDSAEGYVGDVNMPSPGWIGMTITWSNFTLYVMTNSTVLEGSFDKESRILSISLSGLSGTKGAANIRVPRTLCNLSDILISIDGVRANYTISENASDYVIVLEYSHSTHELTAQFLPQVSPPEDGEGEYKLWPYTVAAAVIVLAVALAVMFVLTRKKKP